MKNNINLIECFNELLNIVNENSNRGKGKKSLPVVSLAYIINENNEVKIVSSHINKKYVWNENSKYDKDKYKTHAELLCLEEIEKMNLEEKVSLIITIPPCKHCLTKLKKSKLINDIAYLSFIKQDHKKEYDYGEITHSLYKPKTDQEEELIQKIVKPFKATKKTNT